MASLARAAHGAPRSQERARVCSSESIYQCERPNFSLAPTKRDQMLALTANTWITPVWFHTSMEASHSNDHDNPHHDAGTPRERLKCTFCKAASIFRITSIPSKSTNTSKSTENPTTASTFECFGFGLKPKQEFQIHLQWKSLERIR